MHAHRLHEFDNQEIDVRTALPVAVRAHVGRYAVDSDGQIGAVVGVEAAQIILVRFALSPEC